MSEKQIILKGAFFMFYDYMLPTSGLQQNKDIKILQWEEN
jgi:hypothetical protein